MGVYHVVLQAMDRMLSRDTASWLLPSILNLVACSRILIKPTYKNQNQLQAKIATTGLIARIGRVC